MSDGFITWYHRGWGSVQASPLLHSLEGHGLALGNPSTGLITSSTNGPLSWGEQASVTREELIAAAGLSAISEVNFQIWLDGGTDVFTRIRRRCNSDVAVLEFGLDGMDKMQQAHVIYVVLSEIRKSRDACMGFIVDHSGATEDEDWDAIVLDASPWRENWPDEFALRQDAMRRHPELAGLDGRQESPLTVFESPRRRSLRG
ncbi:hypothetical protein ACFVYE_17405 [Streptomyces sp. NPDC058239]|uniref:hypothetical protein n=1 Tax=Streptomyces sp. NPDC058239 TaxID=3346395 RepID=UPI0036EA8103